ncbi:MAG: ion transporter [Cyclobacteriaceae bacterium]|nr:ion transporter [Cyclobacteriaceae bacterium]
MADKKNDHDRIDLFGLLILILSIYVITALLVDTLFTLNPEISAVLAIVDDIVCVIFLIEFFIRFYRAKSKLAFMKWGWIDLLSSIPTINYLRYARLFRIIRLLRIVRAIKSTKVLIHHFRKNRVESAVASMAILTILLLIFSSITILKAEDVPGGNIRTAGDALWWAFGTITTIGYGDFYPVTTAGRIIAGVLIIFGVGLFGTLSGLITSWFLGHKKDH